MIGTAINNCFLFVVLCAKWKEIMTNDRIGDAIKADSYFRTQGQATNPHNSESSQMIFN